MTPESQRTGDLTTFEVASLEDDQRIITGIATTPRPDRSGDVIDPLGASFTNPVPLLLGHDKNLPVGEVTFGAPTAAGIPFTATLPRIAEAGALKDRVDGAWQAIKARLLKSVSPGYRALANAIKPNLTGGFDFLQTELLELSLVTVPANPNATITNYKAASPTEPKPMPTIQEQITHWTGERAPLAARMTEMFSPTTTLTEIQQAEYDELAGKVAGIDGQLTRLKAAEKVNAGDAKPLTAAVPVTQKAYSAIRVTPTTPPGTAFIRAACARVVKHGNDHEAAMYAESRWPDMPEVAMFLKAAVAPGTTTDATWAGPLVQPRVIDEFIELLRPQTAIGKLGLRRVPFNTKIPAQTGGGTYGWVGEQKPKPVTKLAFSSLTVPYHKTAGIVVITEELAKLSSPSAEDVVRRDMIAGITAFVDLAFLDPARALVANVSPASVTNGTTPITSTGPLGDLVALANAFTTANMPIENLTYIMSPSNALILSFQKNAASGAPMFPNMTASGGTINGMKIVTSGAASTNVIALVPELVLLADDGGITIDVSREASLQMSDSPMDPADATTVFVSLWQNNCVGLRAEWFVTWLKAYSAAARYVSGTAYAIPAGQLMADPAAAKAKKTNGE